jgi:predicted nuclease with TOPRIM domain
MKDALNSLQSIQQKIGTIQVKLNEQKTRIEELETENSLLMEQLTATEQSDKKLKERVIELESKVSDLQNLQLNIDAENLKKAEMKKQIDEMLKEVDKCLAIINHPIKAEEPNAVEA